MTASHPFSAVKQPLPPSTTATTTSTTTTPETTRTSSSPSKQPSKQHGVPKQAFPATKLPSSKTKKASRESKEGKEVSKNTGSRDKADMFSAAISALGSLDIASPSSEAKKDEGKEVSETERGATRQQRRTTSEAKKPEGENEGKKPGKKARDLSPSVAAIFEAVSKESDKAMGKGSPAAASPHPQGVAGSQNVVAESDSSTALKNMLHITTPGTCGPPNQPPPLITGPPNQPPPLITGPPNPATYGPNGNPPPSRPFPSEAVLKLMRPSVAPPRGHAYPRPGLLPDPAYGARPQFPLPGEDLRGCGSFRIMLFKG